MSKMGMWVRFSGRKVGTDGEFSKVSLRMPLSERFDWEREASRQGYEVQPNSFIAVIADKKEDK